MLLPKPFNTGILWIYVITKRAKHPILNVKIGITKNGKHPTETFLSQKLKQIESKN